jgi:hypothetical protein
MSAPCEAPAATSGDRQAMISSNACRSPGPTPGVRAVLNAYVLDRVTWTGISTAEAAVEDSPAAGWAAAAGQLVAALAALRRNLRRRGP